jgi:hypothetical protein
VSASNVGNFVLRRTLPISSAVKGATELPHEVPTKLSTSAAAWSSSACAGIAPS